MSTVDRLKEDDFNFIGCSYEAPYHSMNGFIFRVKGESADILRNNYNIHHKRIYIYYMFENDLCYVEGYTNPSAFDAIQEPIILLEDKNIVKEILDKTLRKNKK
jgi:hypothetical protein